MAPSNSPRILISDTTLLEKHSGLRFSTIDKENFEPCLSKYCLDCPRVDTLVDATLEEFDGKLNSLLKYVSESPDIPYLLIFISAHGKANSVKFKDGKRSIDDIIERLRGVKPPKIFLFQYCRGRKYDKGASCSSSTSDEDYQPHDITNAFDVNLNKMIDLPENTVVGFATTPDRYTGSRKFSNAFMEALNSTRSWGTRLDICSILTYTNEILARKEFDLKVRKKTITNCMQAGHFFNTMNRKLYL